MAHFAEINDNNIVERVVVVPNDQEHRGEEYLNEIGLKGRWIQTSYNNNIRKMFAGIGDEYLESEDSFRSAKPHTSWTWNAEGWLWEPPTPYPNDEQDYEWDEESISWKLIKTNELEES